MSPKPKPDMAGKTLLAVFAHPDDESLAAGGLLACCAARGARVCVLCLTRGEKGPGQPGDGLPDLASTRARELDAAAAVLGVSTVRLLEHPDGMLTWLEPGVLEREVGLAMLGIGSMTRKAVVRQNRANVAVIGERLGGERGGR